uniref:Uncharacterized protein n=1 Tax=Aegilops tauschii subsp. strangulata TaxID=200361 RepID=A0A453C529_AEGTS
MHASAWEKGVKKLGHVWLSPEFSFLFLHDSALKLVIYGSGRPPSSWTKPGFGPLWPPALLPFDSHASSYHIMHLCRPDAMPTRTVTFRDGLFLTMMQCRFGFSIRVLRLFSWRSASVCVCRWSAIATHLPKRTDNEIKNYWNTHLKKRLAKMGIDPVTHKPRSDV